MAKHALLKKKPKRHLAPLGYIFTASLAMVSAIDPYSGTMASASTVQTFEAPIEHGRHVRRLVRRGDEPVR